MTDYKSELLTHKEVSGFKETEIGLIPKDWDVFILSEAVKVNPKRQIKKGTLVKFVSMPYLKEFNKKIQNYDLKKYSGGSRFQNGDTIVARITPSLENGKTAYVDILDDEIGAGSTEFIVLSPENEVTTSQFIYYLSISPKIRERLIKSMTGTSGRQRVENDVFNHIDVAIPPLNEQKAITDFLSAIDQKIELNHHTNQTLEEISRAIFRHWFVHFEFPDGNGEPYKSGTGEMVDSELGMIPVGWKFSRIVDSPVEIIDGDRSSNYPKRKELLNCGDYPFLSTKNIQNNHFDFNETSFVTKEKFDIIKKGKVKENDIVMTTRGSVGNVALFENLQFKSAIINAQMLIFRPKESFYSRYLYYQFTSKNLQNQFNGFSSGSAQPQLPIKDLKSIIILDPNVDVLKNFDLIISKLHEQMGLNNKSNSILSQIRDSLLPKLMSGKVRVI